MTNTGPSSLYVVVISLLATVISFFWYVTATALLLTGSLSMRNAGYYADGCEHAHVTDGAVAVQGPRQRAQNDARN